MNAAVVTRAGRSKWVRVAETAVVLTAIASLHTFIIYLLAGNHPHGYGLLDDSIIEAEVLPVDRRLAAPPAFLPVMLQESRRIELPPTQIAIDGPAETAEAPTQAIDVRDTSDSQLPMAHSPPPQANPDPVIRPLPISGPRGADRYPSASMQARESGKVGMNICVSPAGKVDSVELASSSGFPRLDQVALGIASEYRFQPATLRGHPVAACARFFVVFKLT